VCQGLLPVALLWQLTLRLPVTLQQSVQQCKVCSSSSSNCRGSIGSNPCNWKAKQQVARQLLHKQELLLLVLLLVLLLLLLVVVVVVVMAALARAAAGHPALAPPERTAAYPTASFAGLTSHALLKTLLAHLVAHPGLDVEQNNMQSGWVIPGSCSRCWQ